jgi:hypothetical protein
VGSAVAAGAGGLVAVGTVVGSAAQAPSKKASTNTINRRFISKFLRK